MILDEEVLIEEVIEGLPDPDLVDLSDPNDVANDTGEGENTESNDES